MEYKRMNLRDKLRILIDNQGIDIFKKASVSGIMDDYGCFKEELPAVKNVFKILVKSGYLSQIADMDSDSQSWQFSINTIIHEISDTYGLQEQLVSDILKEYALAIGAISSESVWKDSIKQKSSVLFDDVPVNEIWYTSESGETEIDSDDCIMTPNISGEIKSPSLLLSNEFGKDFLIDETPVKVNCRNKIVSNTYKNGKGIIVFEKELNKIWPGAFASILDVDENGYVNEDHDDIMQVYHRVNLPDNVVEICKGAFANNVSLFDINIPDKVVNIGDDAFLGCMCLRRIDLPVTLSYIGKRAFMGSGLENLVFINKKSFDKSNLEPHIEIDDYAFAGTAFRMLRIPSVVKRIGRGAFERCERLKCAVLPPVARIEPYTFSMCGELESIVIPEGVKEIGHNAFSGCVKLRNIVLPSTVTKIEKDAFDGCGIISIVLQADSPPAVEEIDSSASSEPVVLVPYDALKSYESASDWGRLEANYAISFFPFWMTT